MEPLFSVWKISILQGNLITLGGWGRGWLRLPGPFSCLHLCFIKIRDSRYVTNYTAYIFLQLEGVKNVYESNLGEHFSI